MAMLVKRSGNYDYRIKEHTDKVCTITFYQRDGDKWVEVGGSSFSMEDAKRADLLKPDSGWMKFPRAMLFSRAISQGARIYCPDAIGGVYTDEEIRSIPDRPKETLADEVIEQSKEKPSPDAELSQDALSSERKPVKQETVGEVSSPVKERVIIVAEEVKDSPAPKEENGVPKTFDQLATWVAANLGWKNTKPVRSWMVNGCRIPVDKLDDIDYCYKEISALQGWV